MNKRFMAILIACCLALMTLTACGGGQDTDDASIKDLEKAMQELEASLDAEDGTIDPDEGADASGDNLTGDVVEEATFTLDLPEGWVIDENTEETFSASNELNFIVVADIVTFDPIDPAEYAHEVMESLAEEIPEAEFSEVQEATLAGLEGAVFTLDAELTEGLIQRQENFYYYDAYHIYIVQGAYLADDAEGAGKVQEVLNTLKIKE